MSHAVSMPYGDRMPGQPETDSEQLARLIRASSLAVLCWVEGGRPRAHGVMVLERQGRPVVAFTYAEELVARAAAAAPRLTIAVTEERSTGPAFRPVLLSGRPSLVEDAGGSTFRSDLVLQELRRYPPSRLLADSPLLMREHWWYLPRLIVELDVDGIREAGVPGPAADRLLVVADGDSPAVAPTEVVEDAGGRLLLSPASPAPPGRALLFGQDASFPDLERWSQWAHNGEWDGRELIVEEAPRHVGLEPAPGLLQRWRRQRALERACVRAIPASP
jgi:hypothetical protein